MRVLIACEESQTTCKAYRSVGIEAYSCDIQPCSGGHPEWHIQGDVTNILTPREFMPPDSFYYSFGIPFATQDGKYHELLCNWDLIIAHPPCTYLSKVGAPNMYKNGVIDQERWRKMEEARDFFMLFYNLNGRVVIENPVPASYCGLPPWSQAIDPWQFGDNYTKKTLLWLKNVPPLIPLFSDTECSPASWCVIKRSAKQRSKSFPGISAAMARQWIFERSDNYCVH